MQNLIYFSIAVIILIIFTAIDLISHRKFGKKVNLVFHIIGLFLVIISALILIIREFNLTLFIFPGVILIIISMIIICRSYIEIKSNFLTTKDIQAKGLYARVRHPMYSGIIVFLIGVSLFVSSSLVAIYCLIAIFTLIIQAINEEKYLENKFPKYKKYKETVPMLIPRLWKEAP